MPTTLPLDDGDDDGGQLKPIALNTTPTEPPRPAAPTAAPAPATTPAPEQPAPAGGYRTRLGEPPGTPAPTPRPTAPPPVVRGTPLRTTLRTPNFGRTATRNDAPRETAAPAPQKVWDKPFTDAEFVALWRKIMEGLQNQQLLQNTMRASVPVRLEGVHFVMTVENSIQVDLVRQAMPMLLGTLRKRLINDLITIDVRANDGVPSPETWNDRQVLADIVDHNPIIKDMIAKLHLTLY